MEARLLTAGWRVKEVKEQEGTKNKDHKECFLDVLLQRELRNRTAAVGRCGIIGGFHFCLVDSRPLSNADGKDSEEWEKLICREGDKCRTEPWRRWNGEVVTGGNRGLWWRRWSTQKRGGEGGTIITRCLWEACSVWGTNSRERQELHDGREKISRRKWPGQVCTQSFLEENRKDKGLSQNEPIEKQEKREISQCLVFAINLFKKKSSFSEQKSGSSSQIWI